MTNGDQLAIFCMKVCYTCITSRGSSNVRESDKFQSLRKKYIYLVEI